MLIAIKSSFHQYAYYFRAKKDEPVLLENAKILEVAKRLNKSPAQVVLRFQVERGVIVIPKSVTPSRIESNLNVRFVLLDYLHV